MKDIKQVKNFKRKFIISIFLLDLITMIALYLIIPVIQGYPPHSNDVLFQETVQKLTHIEQHIAILIIGILLNIISMKIYMKKIYVYLNKYYRKESIENEEVLEVRKDCINVPYKLAIFQFAGILALGLLLNFIMLARPFAVVKFTLMIVSLASITSLLILILSQKLIYNILETTYVIDQQYQKNNGIRIKNSLSLQIQMTPFIVVVLIIISLVGYSKAMEKQGDAIANYYKAYLNSNEEELTSIDIDSLKSYLNKIPLYNEKDCFYIIPPNNQNIYVSKDTEKISYFVLEYKKFFIEKTNGRLYEGFGIDEQLHAKKLVDSNGDIWYVGFKFEVVDYSLFVYYQIIDVLVLALYMILSYIWAKSISRNSNRISKNLKEILDLNKVEENSIIPILSNDELGDLAYYYNKIQEKLFEQQSIITIQSQYNGMQSNTTNLAHVIGNDASTINGSISLLYNNDIRNDDIQYKRILDNMNIANDEIRKLVSDMSEQFKMNNDTEEKNINLKNILEDLANVERNNMEKVGGKINISIDKEIVIYGVESKLYLALGNLIKNARITYAEKNLQGDIDIVVTEDPENVNISITDTAGGIPEEIQRGLFKEMLTTRGSHGTGLGLFLTGMNIRVVFKGKITFKTEIGKGTTFYITIPKNVEKKN